jgi:hypothetical protein
MLKKSFRVGQHVMISKDLSESKTYKIFGKGGRSMRQMQGRIYSIEDLEPDENGVIIYNEESGDEFIFHEDDIIIPKIKIPKQKKEAHMFDIQELNMVQS